jgi:hypothetical protein
MRRLSSLTVQCRTAQLRRHSIELLQVESG